MKQYVLTKAICQRLTKKLREPLLCAFCGELIQPMEKEWNFTFNNGLLKIILVKNPEVVSLPYGKHGKSKLYHRECYEKTLH